MPYNGAGGRQSPHRRSHAGHARTSIRHRAAEQAAAAGDYASAERLLREAADLQEASLGPLHPDLANTLNNLGVVCEITDKPDDAERCFRRAYEIAIAVLEPDHPFVATSRKNLEDFCAARGNRGGRHRRRRPRHQLRSRSPRQIAAPAAHGVHRRHRTPERTPGRTPGQHPTTGVSPLTLDRTMHHDRRQRVDRPVRCRSARCRRRSLRDVAGGDGVVSLEG